LTAPAVTTERIGDLLIREGLITRDQINYALEEQRENGTRLGYNLVKLGYVKETELTKILARQHRMPAVDLSSFEVDPRVARMIPGEMATKHLVLPLKREGRTLTVAMVDPTGASVLEDLKFITRCDIFPVIAGEFTLRNAIERYYESNEAQMETLLKDITKFGHDALLGRVTREQHSRQHHDRRGSGRVSVIRNQPGAGAVRRRHDRRRRARAFLRQDPNIIMAGEIRDLETASIAIKAALTGHLVLSTLHTQFRAGDSDAIARHGNRGVQCRVSHQSDRRPTPRSAHLHHMRGEVHAGRSRAGGGEGERRDDAPRAQVQRSRSR